MPLEPVLSAAPPPVARARAATATVALHWPLAALPFAQLAPGWGMTGLPETRR